MLDTSKIYTSNNYGKFKITNYLGCESVEVEFIGTGYKTITSSSKITKGTVKDKLMPSVFGFGFIGEGSHLASYNGLNTKKYSVWTGMLERCYSEKLHKKRPTYRDCRVCDEWHNFQNFGEWFDDNYIEGFELDKDVLFDGNKLYSPRRCLFVRKSENSIKATAKEWVFISPDGDVVTVYNLSNFCMENNLGKTSMRLVHNGSRRNYNGWMKA